MKKLAVVVQGLNLNHAMLNLTQEEVNYWYWRFKEFYDHPLRKRKYSEVDIRVELF